MTEPHTFYSNGKILLCGEYLVLKGAIALAFPTKYGQYLHVHNSSTENIKWTALNNSANWFTAQLTPVNFNVIETNNMPKALYLQKVLQAVYGFNTGISFSNKIFKTNTNFPVNWGLGTSSTLINNLASWAGIDPFKLLAKVSKGSGYDIACASAQTPVLFTINNNSNPNIKTIEFKKGFSEKLYLVYSGQKMATESSVGHFLSFGKNFKKEVNTLNEITLQIIETNNFYEFCELLLLHENILEDILKTKGINARYGDFQGVLKSLGAWGGDFFLAATTEGLQYVQEYFEGQEVLNFSQTIL